MKNLLDDDLIEELRPVPTSAPDWFTCTLVLIAGGVVCLFFSALKKLIDVL